MHTEMHQFGLTDRELECLSWTYQHKTAWETGFILGITERTVNQHLGATRRKLNCRTKYEAAQKAVQLGLIPGQSFSPIGQRYPTSSAIDTTPLGVGNSPGS